MRITKNIALILSLMISLWSCDPLEQVGPRICPSVDFKFESSDLTIDIVGDNPGALSENDFEVSLAGNGLNIKADFSEELKWNIILSMKDGSAEKVYSGESDSIDVFWYGNSKAYPMFKTGDASLKLELACQDPIIVDFKILNDPNFKNVDPKFGILIRDWDMNGVFPIQELGQTDFGWGETKEGFNWATTADVTYENNDPSPAGGYYLNISDSKSNPVWYYGTTGIDGNNYSDFDEILEELPTFQANELWFNIYVKGDQSFENTSMELEWSTTSGRYTYTEHLNWEGWKLISVPLTSFKNGTDPMDVFGGFNGSSYIGFQLGSQPLQSTQAQISFDFAMITVGGPLFDE
ncbi:MAG: hypothetical protein CMP61_09760 [Flavobacteriales bacterium]|nr:hypothetical protein [Flavobacteriales bacterium]|tara:strand:- start:15333 stop:16382 length:1050 start_codon:yes stop_codon:yes gene_type:complete